MHVPVLIRSASHSTLPYPSAPQTSSCLQNLAVSGGQASIVLILAKIVWSSRPWGGQPCCERRSFWVHIRKEKISHCTRGLSSVSMTYLVRVFHVDMVVDVRYRRGRVRPLHRLWGVHPWCSGSRPCGLEGVVQLCGARLRQLPGGTCSSVEKWSQSCHLHLRCTPS